MATISDLIRLWLIKLLVTHAETHTCMFVGVCTSNLIITKICGTSAYTSPTALNPLHLAHTALGPLFGISLPLVCSGVWTARGARVRGLERCSLTPMTICRVKGCITIDDKNVFFGIKSIIPWLSTFSNNSVHLSLSVLTDEEERQNLRDDRLVDSTIRGGWPTGARQWPT